MPIRTLLLLPAEMLAFIEVELPNPKALSKLRNYFQKWRPMRAALPAGELEALGVPRGPNSTKFSSRSSKCNFAAEARTPEERTKVLRQLAGIKEEPKKKPEKPKKKGKGGAAELAAQAAGAKPPEKAGTSARDRFRSRRIKCPRAHLRTCAFGRRGYWREGAGEA